MIDRAGIPEPPAALAAGAVKGWHLAFLFTLVWLAMAAIGTKLARGSDIASRPVLALFLLQALSASAVALVAAVVPELRRSFRGLYSGYRRLPQAADVLLFLAVMITWVYGLNRIAIIFPLIHGHPEWAPTLGVHGRFVTWDATTVLLMAVTTAVIAPFAEELVFRGFLLNLWRRRWGLAPGIVMSSLLFGLFHAQFAAMATLAGIFFALAYLRFGSLWPATLLHGLWNVVSLPLDIAFFMEKKAADVTLASAWVPEMFLAAAFFPVGWLFWRRFRPGA